MQSVRPATAFHFTTGVLINDKHLAILDHIVNITLKQGMSLKGSHHVMQKSNVLSTEQFVTVFKKPRLNQAIFDFNLSAFG